MVEINFLCVHKKLRSKRLAPVLIREITRRVNCTGIFQAVYTAGVVLPKPVATCRYWHRSLNPKKLIEVKFSHLSRNMTMQRHLKLYRLPDETKTRGLRKMKAADIPEACRLMNEVSGGEGRTRNKSGQQAAFETDIPDPTNFFLSLHFLCSSTCPGMSWLLFLVRRTLPTGFSHAKTSSSPTWWKEKRGSSRTW